MASTLASNRGAPRRTYALVGIAIIVAAVTGASAARVRSPFHLISDLHGGTANIDSSKGVSSRRFMVEQPASGDVTLTAGTLALNTFAQPRLAAAHRPR